MSSTAMTPTEALADEDRWYDALVSRDRRFDGWFIAAITTTGIYCRASCPAPVRPKRQNVRFFRTAASAQVAGFRSCKRCRPDAAPGTPEWDLRHDLVGRAMRAIEAGAVDRVGVAGLAEQLHVSERHLHRVLVDEVGASAIALARAQRANLARTLLEATDMAITDVAWAAGFASVRQFNDTIRAIHDRSPTELRNAAPRAVRADRSATPLSVTLRLPARSPIDHGWMFGFHAGHGAPSMLTGDESGIERTLRCTHGIVHLRTEPLTDTDGCRVTFGLEHLGDLAEAVSRTRRAFDLDADIDAVNERLADHPAVWARRARCLGVRVPGSFDTFEGAIGAVIGQQVSVAGARTMFDRLVQTAGMRSPIDPGWLVMPDAATLADADLTNIGLTTRRRETVAAVARAFADGTIDGSPGADRHDDLRAFGAIRGIGPWTTKVVQMRAFGDPDVWLGEDLIAAREAHDLDDSALASAAPWRSYLTCTIWATRGTTPSPKDQP